MALLPNYKNYNILLLGTTGAGKSLFINAFANYFTYKTFDEALKINEPICVIPSCNHITLRDFRNITLKNFGINRKDITNENLNNPACSATQKPRVYSFCTGNIKINFIDVPGFGSTNGFFQDIKNKKLITAIIKKFEKIHSVLVMIQSLALRLTPEIKYSFNEMFMFFHQNVIPNIMFVITSTRTTNYSPVQVFPLLRDYCADLSQLNGITIKLNENTIFCVDNEAYIFQCGWNKSEEYRKELEPLIPGFRESWNFSKNKIIKLLNRIIVGNLEYDVNLSISIETARKFIHNEVYSLASIKKLLHSATHDITPVKRWRFISDILKIDLNIRNMDIYRDAIFDTVFAVQKHVDFDSNYRNVAQTRIHVDENQIFNYLQASNRKNENHSILCDLQNNENVKAKEFFNNIISESMMRPEAIRFCRLMIKALRKDKAFIETAIRKLSVYLKRNSFLLYNDGYEERISLEIKIKNQIDDELEGFISLGLVNLEDYLPDIEKLINFSIYFKEEIDAIKNAIENDNFPEDMDWPRLFNRLPHLSHTGINIQKIIKAKFAKLDVILNNTTLLENFELIQIYYLKFKALLYFASNFHHNIIFVSKNSTNSFIKAITHNFDCFFIDDCFAFDGEDFNGLQKPKRSMLGIFDQMIAITDISITSHLEWKQSAIFKNIISDMDKIDAIFLFIEPTKFNRIKLKDYLSNFSKDDLKNIFFILNSSNISLSEIKNFIIQLKKEVEKYNLKKGVNIRFKNKNVFIFNNDAIEKLIELSETEEDILEIEKSLYESCKDSINELKRIFSTLFCILSPEVKHFKIKIGEKVIYSVEIKKYENIEKILTFEKQCNENILKIEKNSTKIIKLYDIPATKFVVLKFKIDWNEEIAVEILPLYNAITISQNCVAVYNSTTNDIRTFSSSIDYRDINPVIGVNYESPTVVKDAITALGLTNIPNNASQALSVCYLRGCAELVYLIQTNTKPLILNPESVIAELLKEASKNFEDKNETLLLTIPRHFNEAQKTAYSKAAEYANLMNIKFIDYITAYACAFE